MGWLIDVAKAVIPEPMPEAASKPETSDPGAVWARVAITEPGGRTVEVDTPSGWTLADWEAYAERYHGPGCAVTAIAGLPKPRAPVNLDETLRTACEGVTGITPAEFRSLLSPEDLDDIAAGDIHRKTLKAYAQSFAEGIRRVMVLSRAATIMTMNEPLTAAAEDLREAFEERAGILEYGAGLPRLEAELEAARITATLARNRGCTWASLRAALAGYPVLLVQVPDGPGPVDSLPWGTARVHVREGAKPGPVPGSIVITEAEIEAARKGCTVVRQGTFTEAQEVKA